MRNKNYFMVVFAIVTCLFLRVQASAATYKIKPASEPCNKAVTKYRNYNKKTKNFYTIQSYMEKFQKEGGGKLVLKKGTYSITNAIFVPSNTTIVLENGVKIVKSEKTGCQLKPSSSLFHLIRPSKGHKSKAVGKYNGEKNIRIIGKGKVTIDMKSGKNQNCIVCAHNRNITIKNINFKNVRGGHFVELDASCNVLVEGCSFNGIRGDNTREAINLDTPDKRTGGFTAVWSKYDCTANKDVTIRNCTFSNMGRAAGTHNYSAGHPHTNITITGCTMNNMRSYGIGVMYWNNAVITNNRIFGNGSGWSSGILVKGLNHGNLSGNQIKNYYYGILVKTEQSHGYGRITNILDVSERNNLRNNTFINIKEPRIFIYTVNNGLEYLDQIMW